MLVFIDRVCKDLAKMFKPLSEAIDVLQKEETHLAECRMAGNTIYNYI